MTTGEIEKYGTGFIRIRKSLEDYPELELNILNFSDFMRIELVVKSDVGLNVTKDVTKDVTKELTGKHLKILEIISHNPGITVPEIGEIIGLTKRTVKRYISDLKSENYIKREGGRKTGFWKILKNE